VTATSIQLFLFILSCWVVLCQPFLYKYMMMMMMMNKVAAACYCQLRRLGQIRRRVGPEITAQLVLALVTCRLDYCNSVLASLPQSTVEPLQRVQNAAARMIFNLGRHEHVTPCLIQLHWLPVHFRITYSLCTLMHNIRAGKCPWHTRGIPCHDSLSGQ